MAEMTQTYEQELLQVVKDLDRDQQKQVLNFARGLRRPPGTPGKLAIQYAKEIDFPKEDLAEIENAINEAFKDKALKVFPDVNIDEQ